MAVNKVIYNSKILIDLTSDTVSEDTLLKGHTAHKCDGTIVIGKMFEGYPNEYLLYEPIQDSQGNAVMDSSSSVINGKIVYRKV